MAGQWATHVFEQGLLLRPRRNCSQVSTTEICMDIHLFAFFGSGPPWDLCIEISLACTLAWMDVLLLAYSVRILFPEYCPNTSAFSWKPSILPVSLAILLAFPAFPRVLRYPLAFPELFLQNSLTALAFAILFTAANGHPITYIPLVFPQQFPTIPALFPKFFRSIHPKHLRITRVFPQHSVRNLKKPPQKRETEKHLEFLYCFWEPPPKKKKKKNTNITPTTNKQISRNNKTVVLFEKIHKKHAHPPGGTLHMDCPACARVLPAAGSDTSHARWVFAEKPKNAPLGKVSDDQR